MQYNKQIALVLGIFIVGLLIGYAGALCAGGGWDREAYPKRHMMDDDAMNMHGMMSMMTAELDGKTGDAFDRAFLEQMIAHHEGAIAMAKLAQQDAGHAEIKTLAGKIITAQQAEIGQMQAWWQQWFGTATR